MNCKENLQKFFDDNMIKNENDCNENHHVQSWITKNEKYKIFILHEEDNTKFIIWKNKDIFLFSFILSYDSIYIKERIENLKEMLLNING